MFEFGDKYRGKYDESVKVAKGHYTSVSGYMDELLWAGLWLYKATGDEGYLNYVIENAHVFGGITWAITEFSWDVKYAGVQLIASMVQICLSISFSLSLSFTLTTCCLCKLNSITHVSKILIGNISLINF